jgi:hypothetical protein
MRFGRMEQNKLDGASDLLEWSLRMTLGDLVDPNTPLTFTAGCNTKRLQVKKPTKTRARIYPQTEAK